MTPISLQVYTIRTLMTDANHFEMLEKVRSLGYKGVESAAPAGMDASEYRVRAGDLGLVVSSTWGSIESDDEAKQSAETALALGTDLLVSGYGTTEYSTRENINATADKIERMAELLKGEGVTLCVHNHWWEFETVDGEIAHQILANRAPTASFEIDLYWAANFGKVDPAEQVSKHRSRTPLLHVKDGPLVRGEPMQAVGSGKVDIGAAINAADPDVLRWLVIELDECATDMIEAVAESHRFLVRTGLGD